MMESQPEKTLEEQADDILRKNATKHRVSLRKMGIIDERRQRTIREREIPLSRLERIRGRTG
jgi:hypothetical protein